MYVCACVYIGRSVCTYVNEEVCSSSFGNYMYLSVCALYLMVHVNVLHACVRLAVSAGRGGG